MQPFGAPSSDDDDAPDGWHEWRRTQEAIHAAQDDGAGVGDDTRHWREPECEMFPRRARIPGDAPPLGYDDDSGHGYPANWSDSDLGSHHQDDVDGEDEGEMSLMSLVKQ